VFRARRGGQYRMRDGPEMLRFPAGTFFGWDGFARGKSGEGAGLFGARFLKGGGGGGGGEQARPTKKRVRGPKADFFMLEALGWGAVGTGEGGMWGGENPAGAWGGGGGTGAKRRSLFSFSLGPGRPGPVKCGVFGGRAFGPPRPGRRGGGNGGPCLGKKTPRGPGQAASLAGCWGPELKGRLGGRGVFVRGPATPQGPNHGRGFGLGFGWAETGGGGGGGNMGPVAFVFPHPRGLKKNGAPTGGGTFNPGLLASGPGPPPTPPTRFLPFPWGKKKGTPRPKRGGNSLWMEILFSFVPGGKTRLIKKIFSGGQRNWARHQIRFGT